MKKKTATAKIVDVSYVPSRCPLRVMDNVDGSIIFVNSDTNFTVAKGMLKQVRMSVLGQGKYNVLCLVFYTKRNKVNPRCVFNTIIAAKTVKSTAEYICRELIKRKVHCKICNDVEKLFDIKEEGKKS